MSHHCEKRSVLLLALLMAPLVNLDAQQAGRSAASTSSSNPRIGLGGGAPIAVAARATSGAPKLDGYLDEAVWRLATPITDFTQRDPNEGEPATERTEARVLYTDDALYIGVRAYDSHAEEIVGLLTRRDQHSPSDWIGVSIDSYYDRRTAFTFYVNPAGVKRDVYFFDDFNKDNSWNTVWDVKTSKDSEGWTAEFKIPFSQIRFEKGQDRFGFNIFRSINRLNEEQFWRVPPKDQSGMVSRYGDLVGLDGISPPRRAEILPYVSATSTMYEANASNPFSTGFDRTPAAGADINLGLTSNLTLSATVNPDFGQVEADPAVVNLSAFETFFPERRPFFLEGVDIYKFGIGLGDGDGSAESLFYTRRIGRAPQGRPQYRGGYSNSPDQTTIIGSAKLSGKTSSGWTMGALASFTAEESATVIDSIGGSHRDVVEPRTGYFVGSLARDFRDGQTKITLFGTAVNRNLTPNLQWLRSRAFAGGLRWTHRFAEQKFSFNGWASVANVGGSAEAIDLTQRSSARWYQRPDNTHVTYDPNRTSLSGFSGQITFGKISGNWRFSTGLDTRSPGYEVNDAGFQQDADRTIGYVWGNRRWLEPGKVFRQFNVNVNAWHARTYGWEHVSTGFNTNGWGILSNYWNVNAGIGRNLESLSPGTLRGGPAFLRPASTNMWAGIGSDSRKTFRFGLSGFYGRQDQNAGWSYSVNPNISWRPAANLDFTFGPSIFKQFSGWQYYTFSEALDANHYVFGELNQTVTSMTFRANMTFTSNMSLQIYAEPFAATGDYTQFKEVSDPRGATFQDRFLNYRDDQIVDLGDGRIGIDLDRDGNSNIFIGQPDFTVLSFRSNVVLRWEYMLGSTLFLVWQHNRSDFSSLPNFDFTTNLGSIFTAPATNTFVVKLNYWLSL